MNFLRNKYKAFMKNDAVQPKITWLESNALRYFQSDTGLVDTNGLFEELCQTFPDINSKEDKANYFWLTVQTVRPFETK